MFSELEREVQGKSKEGATLRKSSRAFSAETRREDRRSFPQIFPLGYAEELAANKIRVRATRRTFLAGTRSEIRQGN